MAAKYDFYKTPVSKDSMKRPRFHARIVSSGTIDTDDLAKRIHGRCTVTPADVAAVLISLSEVTAEYLREGKRVHIDGLGYLQVTLQCPAVQSTHEIRAESIRFKSVAFRPEVELKDSLKTMTLERAKYKSHSRQLGPERIDQLLASYFAEHEYMTRVAFQRLCGLTSSTAVCINSSRRVNCVISAPVTSRFTCWLGKSSIRSHCFHRLHRNSFDLRGLSLCEARDA